MKIALAAAARRDLAEIHAYIARNDPDAAVAFVADLSRKIAQIASLNLTGSSRDRIRPGLRAVPYRGRTIYFRRIGNRVIVFRVLHQRQDVGQQSFEE